MESQTKQTHLVAACVHAVGDVEERRIEQLSVLEDADVTSFFDDEQPARAI